MDDDIVIDAMTEDVIDRIGKRAGELVDRYSDRKEPLSFGDVEQIWSDELQPRWKEFSSLQQGDEPPPSDSQWRRNWAVPDL